MHEFITRLLARRSDNLAVQLFRYLLVGGAAFAVDFGLLFLLTEYCGFYYQVSAALSFIAGLAANYLLSIKWVFNAADGRANVAAEFAMFALVGVIGLLVNALVMYLLTDLCGVHYLLSKIISTIVVFLWNFFGRRYLITKIPSKQC